MQPNIACNPFVLRQTPDSGKSHYEPAAGMPVWETLIELTARAWMDPDRVRIKDGKDTIIGIMVELPEDGSLGRFYTPVVELTPDTKISAMFGVRANALPNEVPFVQVEVLDGEKAPVRFAEVILYHVSELTHEERTYVPEGSDTFVTVDAQWQIVSLNASHIDEPEPPTPMAMARNMAKFLGRADGAGGTARHYTAEAFVESIMYWSRRGMIAPKRKK